MAPCEWKKIYVRWISGYGNPRCPMRNGHVAMRGQVLLTKSSNLVWEGRKKERESKQKREGKCGILEREAPSSL